MTLPVGTLLAGMVLLGGCNRDQGDTVAPSIRFIFPSEFIVLSNIAIIRVQAGDNLGIEQVIFLADGDTVGRDSQEPYAFEWNTSAHPDCTDTDSYVLLTAAAVDFAGNVGTVQRKYFLDNEGRPPIPVELFEPTNVTKHSATLTWGKSLDWDFSHYILRRDTAATVTISSDSLVRFNDPDATAFTDNGVGVSPFGLLEDTDYSYRVVVYDTSGRSRSSDSVVTIHTLLPQPVDLVTAEPPPTKYTVRLAWEPNLEDVAYYRLHRGAAPQPASLDSIAVFTPGNYTYLDTGLIADSTYYYYLYLIDEAGYTHNFTSADVVEVRTEAIPAPVLNNAPLEITKYSATIAWEAIPPQKDFSWVTLYRGITATVDTNDVVIYDSLRNQLPDYQDNSLSQGQTYSYRMYHIDTQGNTAWSNTVTLTTKSLADVWSGGLGVENQAKLSLSLGWDAYTWTVEADFAGYLLTRDDNIEIFSTTDVAQASFTDIGLTRATPYTYRLTVTDTSGASTAVTLSASTRDIFPANLIGVEPTILWFFKLQWLPSEEPVNEFDHYTILRTGSSTPSFVDTDNDNVADCLPGGDCVEVTTIPGQGLFGTDTLTYDDQDSALVLGTLTDLPIYNYAVLTYDVTGAYAAGNIKGDTLYTVPLPVTLKVINNGGSESTISLQWTQATWPSVALTNLLFARYELWSNSGEVGQTPSDAGSTYQKIFTLIDINTTAHVDSPPLTGATPWHYRILLIDTRGQIAVSNEVTGITKP